MFHRCRGKSSADAIEEYLDEPLRTFRKSGKHNASMRHAQGVSVTGCRCWKCFFVRASGCEDVYAALNCDGFKAKALAVGTVRQCDCQHWTSVREILRTIVVHERLSKPLRSMDGYRAKMLYGHCCGYCRETIARAVGQRVCDYAIAPGAILEADWEPEMPDDVPAYPNPFHKKSDAVDSINHV